MAEYACVELRSLRDIKRMIDFKNEINYFEFMEADRVLSIDQIFRSIKNKYNIIYSSDSSHIGGFKYGNHFYYGIGSEDVYLNILKEKRNKYIEENDLYICDYCNCIIDQDDAYYADDQIFCCDCYNNNYSPCENCGEVHNNDDMFRLYNGDYVCRDCRDEFYFYCENCGELYHIDDMYSRSDYFYCEDCYNNLKSEYINNYSFKPCPIFHSIKNNDNLFMGIELEIDRLNNKNNFAEDVYDFSDYGNLFYMKEDGSLSDGGVEIVSHPCDLKYHLEKFPYSDIIETAKSYDGESHNAGNCGLHIHVSKDYFDSYELSAIKLLFIFERFWKQLAKFSRRTNFQYCEKNEAFELNTEYIKNVKYEQTKHGRYYALNFANDNTIEFRLWRGSLVKETIFSTLELTDCLCRIANTFSLRQLQKMSFDDIKKTLKDYGYKYALKYIKEKEIN